MHFQFLFTDYFPESQENDRNSYSKYASTYFKQTTRLESKKLQFFLYISTSMKNKLGIATQDIVVGYV